MDETDAAYTEPVDYAEPEIDRAARRLDERPLRDRVAVRRQAYRRVALLLVGYLGLFVGGIVLVDGAGVGSVPSLFVPGVLLAAFVFETLDSASGMGFGTSLAPLLFAAGYAPLEVVPVLFLTETVTGLLAGALHHEFENGRFSVRPPLTDATKAVVLLAEAGILGTLLSIALTSLVVDVPATVIEGYVALLVIGMGVVGILRQFLPRERPYRPRRLVGALAYVGLFAAGFPVEYTLLPSLFTGAFLAAIVAPYLVRVLPGRVLEYLIPLYAFAIGAVALAGLLA